jgi:hypothetical protein
MTALAARFARTIIDAVQREYPNAPRHVMRDEDDRPRPREVHPAFYGCFDWHSAVEMHWALAVLLRDVPDEAWAPQARAVLDQHLTEANLRTEADYFGADPAYERPYGWAWALQLAAELADWAEAGDGDAGRWTAHLRPLVDVVEAGFVSWLPRPAYPDRTGMHANSAFALARALPYARRRADSGASALLDAVIEAATRWFGWDADYSARFEPSGSDFLSPALTELVLMREILPPDRFAFWRRHFDQGVFADNLLEPARVTDAEDGQGAHLHGLNLYRVHAFRRLAADVDPAQRDEFAAAVEAHVEAGTAALSAPGWMSEHWLAAYGVLAFR